jgi:hypothetical protein
MLFVQLHSLSPLYPVYTAAVAYSNGKAAAAIGTARVAVVDT